MYYRLVAKIRLLAQGQSLFECSNEATKFFAFLPARQLEGPETACHLVVTLQCDEGVTGAANNDAAVQFVRGKLQQVQRRSLLTGYLRKQVVDFVDEQHARRNGSQQPDRRKCRCLESITGAIGRINGL